MYDLYTVDTVVEALVDWIGADACQAEGFARDDESVSDDLFEVVGVGRDGYAGCAAALQAPFCGEVVWRSHYQHGDTLCEAAVLRVRGYLVTVLTDYPPYCGDRCDGRLLMNGYPPGSDHDAIVARFRTEVLTARLGHGRGSLEALAAADSETACAAIVEALPIALVQSLVQRLQSALESAPGRSCTSV